MALPDDAARFVSDSIPLWKSRLKISNTGRVIGSLENIAIALRGDKQWAEAIVEDQFKQQITLLRPPPWNPEAALPIVWQDQDTFHLREWLQQQGVPAPRADVYDAVQMVASEHHVHEVNEYLDKMVWDGKPRIDTWLNYYCGAEDTPFSRAVGSRWLISAIARIRKPGCKVDTVLILEGRQGSYKSSVFRTLGRPWFTDEVSDLGSKDAAQQMRGTWIIELAELDAMTRADATRIKSWISRSVDRYRPSYGRIVMEFPRQCVFGGTCNRSDYLRDDTGGRRFWPVKIGSIDLDALEHDRDQLWAEAAVRFSAGERWWLHEEELVEAAEEIQNARRAPDAWEDPIAEWLANRPSMVETSTAEIMGDCLGLGKDRWSRADQMRVGDALRIMGWERVKKWRGGRMSWVFVRTQGLPG